MNVSVVILVWNGRQYIEACLNSVFRQQYDNEFEVIVVDNASVDGSAELIKDRFPQIRLIQNEHNLGFSGGMNIGTGASTGDIVVWLNQDTVAMDDWLQNLTVAFLDEKVGVAGCKILESDRETIHHAGGEIDILAGETYHFGVGELDYGQYNKKTEVAYVTGAAMAVHRSVLEKVGELDERFFPGYYEDADYCLRVHDAGYKVQYVPDAVIVHHVSTSTGYQWHKRQFYYYRNRWLFLLKHRKASDLSEQFFLQEQERLKTLSFNELHAMQTALSELIVRSEAQVVRDKLIVLYEMTTSLRNITLPDMTIVKKALDENRSHQLGAVGAILPSLSDLSEIWQIKDYRFQSSVPILGRVIVAFRTLWNAISAKWYTLALFNQQNRVNYLFRKVMLSVTAYLSDNDTVLMLLEKRYTQLEQRLTELEEKYQK